MTPDRNTITAFVLAISILLGWEYFFAPKKPVSVPAPAAVSAPATLPEAPASDVPVTAAGAASAVGAPPAAAAPEQRIKIETPHLHGSLALTGGRLDDISLVQYRDTLDPKSPEVVVFSPVVSAKPYYAELGWLSSEQGLTLPTPATTWTTENPDAVLTETTPVVLTWDNGQGLKFTRTIKVDRDYLFTIEQSVENTGEKPVTLFPYGLIARLDNPAQKSTYISHEGPVGVFNGASMEKKYDDVKKAGRVTAESTGGWIGMTDKYWLSAVAFDPKLNISASFNYADAAGRERYQTDLRADAITVATGEKKAVSSYVFAGAKELGVLDQYSKDPGLPRLDLAIDFGWFWFLTIPFFHALRWLNEQLGNFGLAILAFSTVVRGLMFPIANKQFKAMNNMKRLQPQMKALQDRHASDRTKMNQEMMELYKREKVNPLTGCLPIAIQIPVFFALYKVLFVTIEMRHAPFYGWIHDLSAADPTSVLNLFGLLPYTIPTFLHFVSIGAWPLIYGVTMFLQQRLSPQPADPMQARVMMYLPIIFTFVLASMPAGLVIYWAWSNTLAILQQWALTRSAKPA
jgi:YidC/Oxa1 family membrane protein insertase